ncbi:MAG: hypothetical protein ACPKPY_03295 [Nitrososphaeraceae archaeon]
MMAEKRLLLGDMICRFNKQSKSNSFRGSFCKTSSNDKLAFLNNNIRIFETEVDESGLL